VSTFGRMCGANDPGSCIRWVLGFGLKIGYDRCPHDATRGASAPCLRGYACTRVALDGGLHDMLSTAVAWPVKRTTREPRHRTPGTASPAGAATMVERAAVASTWCHTAQGNDVMAPGCGAHRWLRWGAEAVTGSWLVGGNSVGVATRAKQRRGIGGRERADGRVPAVSSWGAHAGVARGRPTRRKWPTTLYQFLNSFSNWINHQDWIKIGEILSDLRKIWNFVWR
jgi:hypothetical protein